MSVEVADLVANLSGKDDGFGAMMAMADQRMGALSKSTHEGMNAVQGFGLVLGALSAGVLVDSIKKASDYQLSLAHIQANTGSTTVDMKELSSAILAMSASTGANLDQLGQGFMHIRNFGFSAADAMKILKPAMESALSTGDDVGQVASTLAVALHEFHLGADQAAVSMNVLHLAAQMGNATLGEFVEGTTRAFNLAGGFGLKLEDISAALSTLTQSGQSARAASDGLSAVMNTMVKPTAAATAMLNTLSKATGIDLVRDFSASGLKARGFTNTILDVQAAINKMGGETALQRKTLLDYADSLEKSHVTGDAFTKKMTAMARSIGDPTQSLIALFPNVRAFREMMLLTGSQADSFAVHMKAMKEAMAGLIDPTSAGFQTEQATFAGSLQRVAAALNVIQIEIGSALLPSLMSLLQAIQPVVAQFTAFATAHPQLIAGLLGIGAAIGAISAVSLAAGPALAVLTGPIGLLAAAGVGLYEAWTHDFLGIQEVTARVWSVIHPVFDALGSAIDHLRAAFGVGGFAGAFASLPSALAPVQSALGDVGGKLLSAINGIGTSIRSNVARWASDYWSWTTKAISMEAQFLAPIIKNLLAWTWNTGAQIRAAELQWAEAFWSWVQKVWPPLSAALGNLLGQLGNWISGTALPYLHTHVGPWADALWQWVERAVSPLLSAAGGLLGRFGIWISGTAAPALGRQLSTWAGAFSAWIGPAATRFLQQWPGILNRFLDWIGSAAAPILTKLANWGLQFIAWIAPKLPAIGLELLKINAAVLLFIAETAGTIATKVVVWAAKMTGWIVTHAIPKLNDAWAKFVDALGSLIRTEGGKLGTLIDHWALAFDHWVGAGMARLKPQVQKITTDILNWLGDTGKVLLGAGSSILHGLITGIEHQAPHLGSYVRSLTTKVIGWLGDTGSVLLNAGKNILNGLIAGMKAIAPQLMHYLAGLGADIVHGITGGIKSVGGGISGFIVGHINDATNAARKAVGAHSPSQVYHELGVNIVQGLINGMNSQHGALVAASNSMMGALNLQSSGGGIRLSPALRLPAGLGGGGPVTVHHTSTITVSGVGSAADNRNFAELLEKAQEDMVKQMAQAARVTTAGTALPGNPRRS